MDVKVAEGLWASSTLPEGILERWLAPDWALVGAGDPLALVRIEDSLHDILAPGCGRLTILAAVNSVIEPDSVLGRLAS